MTTTAITNTQTSSGTFNSDQTPEAVVADLKATVVTRLDPIQEKVSRLVSQFKQKEAQVLELEGKVEDLKRQNEQLQKENEFTKARLGLVENGWTAAVNIRLEREEEIEGLKAENQNLKAENTCKTSQLHRTEQFARKVSGERDQLNAQLSKTMDDQKELVDKASVVLAKMKQERALLVQRCFQLANALHQGKKLASFSADEKTPAEEGPLHPSWAGEISGVFLFKNLQ